VVKDYGNKTYVYVTGYSYRGKREKHADYCTLKYDSDGNLIWDKRYDSRRNGQDYPNALAVDDDGNVYVTGRSEESLEDEPLRSFDYLTIKYSDRGRLRWEKRYEGIGVDTDDVATAILVKQPDPLGNVFVYVTGYSEQTHQDSGLHKDFATIKYHATNGEEVWTTLDDGAVIYDGGYNDEANALAVDDADNIYVSGYSFNDDNKDFATIKYDTDGNEVWKTTERPNGEIRYDGGGDDVATDMVIKADELGDIFIYVTGYSEQDHPGTGLHKDFATIKYDTDGIEVWPDGPAITDGGVGDDEAAAIFVDDFGDIYVTGTSQKANIDYFTVRYNPDGSVIWMGRYNSATNWNDFAKAIVVVDSEGSVYAYVTGFSQKPGSLKNNYILTVKY